MVKILARKEELCMGCMHPIGDEIQCQYCGLNTNAKQIDGYLPFKTIIGNRYLVGAVLDHNGDGTSYIGWDISAQIPVVIREYMPDSISARSQNGVDVIVKIGNEEDYLDLMTEFIKMWSHLLDINTASAMIDVYDIVEEHNTVYAIHEYVDGITLREYLLRTPKGYISWEKARGLFMPVLSTIGNLHSAGIIHRGISPVTLIMDTNGKLRLTGFSIKQSRTLNSPLNSQLFNGYSAVEQYSIEGQQGPWTDIYSFAAVLYRALIGSDPIDAKSRVTNDRLMIPGRFAEQIPAFVINGLINALQILPEDRTRSVEQCRAELSASPSATVSIDEDDLFQSNYSDYDNFDRSKTVIADESDYTLNEQNDYGNEPLDFTGGNELNNLNEKNEKSSNALQIFLAVFGILIALAIIIFALIRFNIISIDSIAPDESTTSSDYEVEVPNFTNRFAETIRSTAEFTDHFVFTIEYQYSDTFEQGVVISQDTIAHSKVKNGSTIHLVVSKGIEQIELTNVEGMSYDSAVKLLSDRGFTVRKDTIIEENDGSQTPNTVYKMSPSATTGRSYDKGTTIILTVWGEVPTTPINIPEITVLEDETTTAQEETTVTTK